MRFVLRRRRRGSRRPSGRAAPPTRSSRRDRVPRRGSSATPSRTSVRNGARARGERQIPLRTTGSAPEPDTAESGELRHRKRALRAAFPSQQGRAGEGRRVRGILDRGDDASDRTGPCQRYRQPERGAGMGRVHHGGSERGDEPGNGEQAGGSDEVMSEHPTPWARDRVGEIWTVDLLGEWLDRLEAEQEGGSTTIGISRSGDEVTAHDAHAPATAANPEMRSSLDTESRAMAMRPRFHTNPASTSDEGSPRCGRPLVSAPRGEGAAVVPSGRPKPKPSQGLARIGLGAELASKLDDGADVLDRGSEPQLGHQLPSPLQRFESEPTTEQQCSDHQRGDDGEREDIDTPLALAPERDAADWIRRAGECRSAERRQTRSAIRRDDRRVPGVPRCCSLPGHHSCRSDRRQPTRQPNGVSHDGSSDVQRCDHDAEQCAARSPSAPRGVDLSGDQLSEHAESECQRECDRTKTLGDRATASRDVGSRVRGEGGERLRTPPRPGRRRLRCGARHRARTSRPARRSRAHARGTDRRRRRRPTVPRRCRRRPPWRSCRRVRTGTRGTGRRTTRCRPIDARVARVAGRSPPMRRAEAPSRATVQGGDARRACVTIATLLRCGLPNGTPH